VEVSTRERAWMTPENAAVVAFKAGLSALLDGLDSAALEGAAEPRKRVAL
jgi:hypothetical protein